MSDYIYNDPLAEHQAPTMPPEDRSPATPPEALSGELLNDLRILLPLLTKLDNTEGRTREEEIARRQRLAQVRKLVFALQQGQGIHDASNHFTEIRLGQENALAARNGRIAALRAALNRQPRQK